MSFLLVQNQAEGNFTITELKIFSVIKDALILVRFITKTCCDYPLGGGRGVKASKKYF